MNVRSLLPILCCGVLATNPCAAQQPSALESPELAALRTAYDTQIKTLREQYQTKLDALAATQVAKGDLGSAVATRDELKKLDAPASTNAAAPTHVETNPFYSGTIWWEGNIGSVAEFRTDGIWSEIYKGCQFFGRWKTNGLYSSVTVTLADGATVDYVVSAYGANCTRVRDKLSYGKITTHFRTETMAGLTAIGKPAIPLAASPYSGSRWQNLNGKATIEFKPDGSWIEHWEGKDTAGKWATTPIKTEVKVTWPKSEPLIFVTSDDGLFSLRANDHMLFKLLNPKSATPSATPNKGGSNPFGSQ